MLKTMTVRTTIAAILAGLAMSAHALADAARPIDIPAGDLITALESLAQQADVELVYQADQLKGIHTGGVSGTYKPKEAVSLLLEGTQLTIRTDETTGVMLVTQPKASQPLSLKSPSGSSASQGEGRGEDRKASTGKPDGQERIEIEELVVTGTHVRGTRPVAPVQVFMRDDFDRAGATTAQEFLALLPQNFGGTQSADTTESAIPGVTFDLGYGSAVNLRGVGGASTLILIDGRRMAAAGTAAYSDVSMIPLAAVERIEVMTDGAAALYGSDAIGGVVNFILRKDFSGAETRLRYGDTTQGGLAQRQASQLFGTKWDRGNAVLAYEYVDQDELNRTERDFSANTPGTNNGPRPLVPAQERSSVALFAKQGLGDRLQISANGIYSQREGAGFSWDPTNLVISDTAVERKQYGGGIGVTVDLGRAWEAQVSGNADKSTLRRTNLSPIERFNYDSVSDLWSASAQLTGDLWQLPWGAIKLALGADYREESLDRHDYLNGALRTSMASSLSTKAAYGELSIPIGSRGARSRAPVEVSLAGRYEEHGNPGNTFDPKFGARWSPLQALSFYASYGTSFKVPSLDQLNQSRNVNSISNVTDVTVGGPIRALTQLGNNQDLSEEAAKILSAGFEFSLPVLDGLQGRVNYFDIDYTDRIASVTATAPNILALPAYEALVVRRGEIPEAEFDALATELLSGADARVLGCTVPVDGTGACGTPVSSVRAIIDRRLQNFSAVQVQGLDLSLAQSIDVGESYVRFSFDASYALTFDETLNPASAERSILSTLYSPVDFRFRTVASWDHIDWEVALSANYTDDYSTRNSVFRGNNRPMPVVGVDAWTTFDLTFSYRLGNKIGGLFENSELGLNVSNLLDEDPPYVDDQYIGLGYDPANADPRGRFISVMLSKSW